MVLRKLIGIFLSVAILIVPGAGCRDSTYTLVSPPETPRALIVSGSVTGLSDGRPVASAQVAIPLLHRVAHTDSLGDFSLGEVPPGEYRCEISAPGFLAIARTLDVGGPGANTWERCFVEFILPENAGDQRFLCRSAVDGSPLAGIRIAAVLDSIPPALAGADLGWPQAVLSAVTDSGGVAVLPDLPPWTLRIVCSDQETETRLPCGYAPCLFALGEAWERTAVRQVDLVRPSPEAPELLDSSLWTLSGEASPVIYFLFDRPMLTDPRATFFRVCSMEQSEFRLEWVSDVMLRVEAMNPFWCFGYLELIAFSAEGAGIRYFGEEYWTPEIGSGAGVVCEGNLTPSVGTEPLVPDYDSAAVHLAWPALDCATEYLVFAKDDYGNPDWVQVAGVPCDFDLGSVELRLDLPPEFDRFANDGVQTPLAGIELEFCVVPLASPVDPYELPPAGVVLRDERAPRLDGARQSSVQINTFYHQVELVLAVDFSEYLAEDAAAPVLEIVEAGGDPDFALDPAGGSWIWNPLRDGGRFRFLIPYTANITGDLFRVVADDLVDLSGNLNEQVAVTPYAELVGMSVFDFETGTEGWTVEGEGNGWELGTPTVGPSTVYSGRNCWATNLDGDYDNDADVSLISPWIVVPGGSPKISFYAWTLIYGQDRLVLWLEDSTGSQTIWMTGTSFMSWERHELDLTSVAGATVRFRFEFTSNSTFTSSGPCIDLITVYSD